MHEAAKDDMRIALWKRQKYAYQQAYRILAHAQVEEHLCADIGGLSDITRMIPTSDLRKTCIEVDFKVQPEEQ